MAVKIFFCYAREDEALLDKLKTHLKPLQRQGLIDLWHDRDISAGTEWEREINTHLNAAQIILLLISPDFMNSDYCYGIELKRAIERHERGEARVIPIILDHVYWQITPINTLQALPSDAKPIMSAGWHNLNEALFNVVQGIRKAIEDTFTKSSPIYSVEENMARRPQLDRFDKFTEYALQTLDWAQWEAKRLYQNYLGTEHLLLGLLHVEECNAMKILASLGIELNVVRNNVEAILDRVQKIGIGMASEIGLNSDAKKVIELSVDEARRLQKSYLGTEHLLLALIRLNESIASKILIANGVTLEKTRLRSGNLISV